MYQNAVVNICGSYNLSKSISKINTKAFDSNNTCIFIYNQCFGGRGLELLPHFIKQEGWAPTSVTVYIVTSLQNNRNRPFLRNLWKNYLLASMLRVGGTHPTTAPQASPLWVQCSHIILLPNLCQPPTLNMMSAPVLVFSLSPSYQHVPLLTFDAL